MPYICKNAEEFVTGKAVGTGECVAFVQACSSAPNAKSWKEGIKVQGNGAKILKGAAIATFVGGKYENKPTGNHAAIYIEQDAEGIWVYDQWKKQGQVKKRKIRFNVPPGTSSSNDGARFSVVE